MSGRAGLLLVGNWDSDVGYAWWLMESFWAALAEAYHPSLEVYVAFPRVTEVSPVLCNAPLHVLELDFVSRKPADLAAQCRTLRKLGVKTLYLSDWGTWKVRYVLYRWAGVRTIIVHDHTPGLRVAPAGLKWWVKQIFNRAPMIAADAAIGATEFVRQRLIDVSGFPPSHTYVASNGVAPRHESMPAATDVYSEFDIPRDRAIVVMVSRANRYKNVHFVLKCLASLRRQGRNDVHFLFIGDGPHLEEFRKEAARLGVEDACSFPGRRSDVPEILPACAVALHPAQGEVGYSLSILEYMRAGLAVVVPDNPSVCGATEQESTGLVYREGDIEQAVACLLRLVDDKELNARFGKKAAEVVEQGYRLEHTHQALLSAFACIDPLFPSHLAGEGKPRVPS